MALQTTDGGTKREVVSGFFNNRQEKRDSGLVVKIAVISHFMSRVLFFRVNHICSLSFPSRYTLHVGVRHFVIFNFP